MEQIVVIGTAPLAGSDIDSDKIPANVQTLSAAALNRDGQSDVVAVAAARELASVNLNDEQGSQFQPDLVYRGFEASPISGVAEGLAVYQGGVRLNEAMGDNVNWDLVPQFALNRMSIQSNNPVFGLDALGGAVTLDMKDGFNSQGGVAQLSGGSYGNLTGSVQYAVHSGHWGFYAGGGGTQDGGFREVSPTYLHQGYGDVGYEAGAATLHLSLALADNVLDAVGPTPVQMLATNPRAVFTYPQSMHNQMQLLQLRGSLPLGEALLISGSLYHRHYTQYLVDGNTTDVTACGNNTDYFCLEGNDLYPADVLYDSAGQPVPVSTLPAGATPGETDYTHTATSTDGLAMQATFSTPLFGRANRLVAGVSLDHSVTVYGARGELGTLLPSLEVVGAAATIDQADSATASPPIEAPVLVQPTTAYYGAYFSDVIDLDSRLAWTISGRYNRAQLDLRDLLGDTLDSTHRYGRFNPGTGLTYRLSAAVTAYGGYSQANRAPTAGELSCADPHSPCLLDAFLVSDPALKQVVSRTWELGLRGRLGDARGAGALHWNIGLYRTDDDDDIMLLATAINGFGYFANAGQTRRQGVETGLDYQSTHWSAHLNYSLLQATFRDNLRVASNSPAADADGDLFVTRGDRIPMTARNRATAGSEFTTPRWACGADLSFVGAQYLAGDESNQEPALPAYATLDLHAAYRLARDVELFALADNVLDRRYYSYGTFTGLGGLPPNFNLTDPRSYSPGMPVTVFGGVRISL